ncbi:MAG: hypothetical protein ABJH72_04365 [Reichenbachiella sp.]|uniref:hypothetical protein n=1 Tax=Reichenbachiella sp. TaxID=2184521 RepID=UPI00329805E6
MNTEFEITREKMEQLTVEDVEKMYSFGMKSITGNPHYIYRSEGEEREMIEEFLKDGHGFLSTGSRPKVEQLIIYFLIQYEWILSRVKVGEEFNPENGHITKLFSVDSFDIWVDRVIEIEDIDKDFENTLSFFETSEEGIKNYLKYGDLYESVANYVELGEKLSGELFELFFPNTGEQIIRRI